MPALISKPRKLRLVNPPKKRRKAAAPKRVARKTLPPKRRKRPAVKRRNGPLSLLGPLNPPRSKPMKKRKPAGRKTAARKNPTRRRRNPVAVVTKHRRRAHRNPSGLGGLTKPGGIARTVAMSAVGLVVARMAPQAALGPRNSGIIGYAANVVTAMAAGYAASKLTGNKQDGYNVAIGGFLYTVSRVLQERYNAVGQYLSLSGVGDAMSATPRQLGIVDSSSYFTSPAISDIAGNPVVPQAFLDAATQASQNAIAAAQPVRSAMAGLGRSAFA